ncbi:MAG: hypothetical protein KDK66_07070, partial [Deltaproteobacteria bacterium]|nr:hypothetical protein [Deltaproteobacteria bacterium]
MKKIKTKILTLSLFLISCLSLTSLSQANMAEPWIYESPAASPFLSQEAEIIEEKLTIIPDATKHQTIFKAEYQIKVSRSGKQIPLLFSAIDFLKDFKVSLDGQPVQLKKLEPKKLMADPQLLQNFSAYWKNLAQNLQTQDSDPKAAEKDIQILWAQDLHSFEVNLSQGPHLIQVSYLAQARQDTIKEENSFRYDLSPAKHWKSLNKLSIFLDTQKFPKFKSNLGPAHGQKGTIVFWEFSRLPVEVIHLDYPSSSSSRVLSWIREQGPMILSFLIFGVLVGFHLKSLKNRHRKKRLSYLAWPVLAGFLLLPFSGFFAYWLLELAGNHLLANYGRPLNPYLVLYLIAPL